MKKLTSGTPKQTKEKPVSLSSKEQSLSNFLHSATFQIHFANCILRKLNILSGHIGEMHA